MKNTTNRKVNICTNSDIFEGLEECFNNSLIFDFMELVLYGFPTDKKGNITGE